MATTESLLQAWLDPAPRRIDGFSVLHPAKRVMCADGFSMSVQAGATIYCSPRDSEGPWHTVEVGYPTEQTEELMPFVGDAERPTDTVYGYVPVDIVCAVIDRHGGFCASLAPAQNGGSS